MVNTISVVLCTHNGEQTIQRTIESLINQSITVPFEIVIIDNSSDDNTPRILEEMGNAVSTLKIFREPLLGLSFARNTGWKNASGQFIAFTDDDAIPAPDWLENILESFERGGDRVAQVGGPVEPIWEKSPPPWLTPKLIRSLALIHWADSVVYLPEDQWLAGANMAFRRDVLEQVGGFHPLLGRQGKRMISMEELFITRQISEHGYLVEYNPKISVRHRVPAARLETGWFLKRFFWQGYSEAIYDRIRSKSIHKRCSRGIATMRALFGSRIIFQMMRTKISPLRNCQDPKTIESICFGYQNLGYMWGLLIRRVRWDW